MLLACGKAGIEIRKKKIREKDKMDFIAKNSLIQYYLKKAQLFRDLLANEIYNELRYFYLNRNVYAF